MQDNTDPAYVLDAAALTVWRGGRKVLDGLCLHVEQAEILTVVGPSGSGKSSLLYALARLIPYEGSIRSLGRMGVVFQDHGTFPWLTVRGNVSFGIRSLPETEREETVRELLDTCGLREVADRYPMQLSGGQRQRVGIARTLAQKTKLLLLDEPFASLDVVTRLSLQAWIRRLVDKLGVSVVLVTHDIDDAVRLSDRISVLVDGQIKMETSGCPGTRQLSQGSHDIEVLRQSLVEAMTRYSLDLTGKLA